MKEKAYEPSRTNTEPPQTGMASVDTNNFDELEQKAGTSREEMPAEPKNFDEEESAEDKE